MIWTNESDGGKSGCQWKGGKGYVRERWEEKEMKRRAESWDATNRSYQFLERFLHSDTGFGGAF